MGIEALAIALAFTGAAPANPGDVATFSASASPVAAYVRIAEQAWPQSQCDAHERIAFAAAPIIDGEPASGFAYQGSCTFVLDAALLDADPVTACDVVVHELGHLAGLGHSDDPASIMYGGATLPVWKPCAALELSRTLEHAHGRRMTVTLGHASAVYEHPAVDSICWPYRAGVKCWVGRERYYLTLANRRIAWHWIRYPRRTHG